MRIGTGGSKCLDLLTFVPIAGDAPQVCNLAPCYPRTGGHAAPPWPARAI